ncbi:Purine-binding protein [bacterium HR39]|nr:Purine-binding protein [bacterium HR39]
MNSRFDRRRLLGSLAAAGTLALAPGLVRAQQKKKVKAGWVYVGPIGDHGWTYRHDVGRRDVEKALGELVETTYVEKVSEGPDAERVLRQMAATGHDIVFATSFGFMNAVLRVAQQFPQVKFEHATGYRTAPNVAVYNARFYEGRAVIGTIAGHVSKSGIVGYVGSFPIPEVVRGINAFTLAMRKVRPDAQIKVVWVDSWYDPAKEADAAKALIDQGADVITQHTDSAAPLQVAEERGVVGFGQASDMSKFAPNAHLTAIIDDWGPYYIQRVKAVLDGTWNSHSIWWGMKEGMIRIAPYNPRLPREVVEAAERVRTGIIAGTLHPFAGPIYDQKGQLRVPEGRVLSDEDLLKMDWYVQGVQA